MVADTSVRAAARRLGLKYLPPETAPIRRRKHGKGFSYVDQDGKLIRDPKVRTRIQRLVIPPAWEDVRIATEPMAHIQAVGRDEAGRIQYIYHKLWERLREEAKARRLAEFAKALPSIRRAVKRDLSQHAGSFELAVSACVALIDEAAIRVGEQTHLKRTGARGAATLRQQHVRIEGDRILLCFPGKGGKEQRTEVAAKRLAQALRRLKRLGGRRIFCYRAPAGQLTCISAREINTYLSTISGRRVSAKDFRTFHATALAGDRLAALSPESSDRKRNSQIVSVVKEVAQMLGNTVTIARKSYVHDVVLTSFVNGQLERRWRRGGPVRRGLGAHESALARFLERASPRTLRRSAEAVKAKTT